MVYSHSDQNQSRGLILLCGLPRSGTTWLGKLFDSHPDTLYRHEPDSWRHLPMPRYPDVAGSATYAESVCSFAAGLPFISASRVAGKRPVFSKRYLTPIHFRALEASVHLAHFGSLIHRNFPVFMHSPAAGYSQRRVVWKSIESLGRMGVLMEALPGAVGIHLMRHPCGYIASVLRGLKAHNFADNTAASEDYGIFNAVLGTPLGEKYNLSLSWIKALTPEERMAWQWVLINEKAWLDCRQTGRVLLVRYEDVCREPMSQIERVFGFAGLDVTEQTRRFATASTVQANNDYYSIFKNPQVTADRWREELEPGIIERVMAIVQQSRFAGYYGSESDSDAQAVM